MKIGEGMRKILKVKMLKTLMRVSMPMAIRPTLHRIWLTLSRCQLLARTCRFLLSPFSIIYLTLYNMNDSTIRPWFSHTWLQLLLLFAVSFCLKMALAPAYFSTDHDVHQNWLRITACKPLEEWYFDTESKWTLDYPPLFAYFEWLLSSFSKIISPSIASSINQMRFTVYYQRATVIISEIPYLLVLFWIFKQINAKMVVAYFSLPFIILDNIHFQYNIIMQAIFLLSVQLIRRKQFTKGAFVYSILLNFKHIYLYSSLAFFIVILKEYVLNEKETNRKLIKLAQIGIVTLIPFIVAFLPFIAVGGIQQIWQILSRLFPFQRGLIHDYWAPNFWALYYFADKVLNVLLSKFGTRIISIKDVSQLHSLSTLPSVPPILTTIIILTASIPLLLAYFRGKRIKFEWLVFFCGCIFFLFGFHVHEKAIAPYIGLLMVFLPSDEQGKGLLDCAIFVNIINLLPLLISPNEKILRVTLPLLWISIWQKKKDIVHMFELTIVTIGLGLVFFHQILHPLVFKNRMEFLPLMLNSIFCASFNICWIGKLYIQQALKGNNDYNPVPAETTQP